MESKISIIRAFEDITDPRIDRTKLHKLIDIIFITIGGVLYRCEGWDDIECFANERIDWLRKFVELENGIPSHDTIRKVFNTVSNNDAIHLLSAWASKTNVSAHTPIIHQHESS